MYEEKDYTDHAFNGKPKQEPKKPVRAAPADSAKKLMSAAFDKEREASRQYKKANKDFNRPEAHEGARLDTEAAKLRAAARAQQAKADSAKK